MKYCYRYVYVRVRLTVLVQESSGVPANNRSDLDRISMAIQLMIIHLTRLTSSHLVGGMSLLTRLPPEPLRLIAHHLRLSVLGSNRRYATSQPSDKPSSSYSHTVLLPKTDLPVRHKNQAAVDEIYKDRTTTELYKHQVGALHACCSPLVAYRTSTSTIPGSCLSCTMDHLMPMATYIWVRTATRELLK